MNRYKFSAALLFAAALALPSIIHAQPLPAATQALVPNARNFIKVRNTPVSFIAYWLDPLHNSAPRMLERSKSDGGGGAYGWASDVEKMTRQPGNGNGPRGLKMPTGIESIDAIDPQNVLVVKGTPEGIEALRKLVAEIDVPIGQVEIEAQIVEIAPAEFAQWPLKFRNASRSTATYENNTFGQLAFAPIIDDVSPVTRQLNTWIAAERARTITVPRVTAIDGLAASLSSTEIRAFDVNAMQEAQTEAPEPVAEQADETPETAATPIFARQAEKLDDDWQWGKSRIHSEVGLKAMPVLHGDLIALAFQIAFDNEVTTASTTLRDGQTLPVRLAGADAKNGWVRVALIKAKIIRRAGDKLVVPGT